MGDVDSWFRTNTANGAASPDGWAEGMLRSEVNDTGRETHAAVKRFYDDPGYRKPFLDYTHTGTGTSFNFQDGTTEAQAGNHMAVGQRIRMTGQGADSGTTFIGTVATVGSYVLPNQPYTVTWILPVSTAGPTVVVPSSAVEVHDKELGTSAFSNIGTTTGQTPAQIPTIDDLDAHVLKAESALDVGFLGGRSGNEIAVSSHHGRFNFNGDMSIWQRGTDFTAASVLDNADGNLSADGWVILSNGSDQVDISRETSQKPDNFSHSMKLTSNTSGASVNHGICHIVEGADVFDVTGPNALNNEVSLSFYALEDPANTGINTVRVYLLRQVTSPATDPVGTWPSPGAALVPSAGWEIIANESVSIATTWARYTPANLTNIDPDPSNTGNGNIAIVITPDVTPAVNQVWFLTGVQLNHGPSALPFVHAPKAIEYQRAQRYCISTMDDGKIGDSNGIDEAMAVFSSAAGDLCIDWRFPVPMFEAGTIVPYNPRTSTANKWDDNSASSIAVVDNTASTRGGFLTGTGATADTLYYIAAYVHANIWGNN